MNTDEHIAVVYKEHTLGILGSAFGQPSIGPLNGLAHLGGAHALSGPFLFVTDDEFRPATLEDFHTFRVVYHPSYKIVEPS
jgi:hypothetical protein